LREDKESTKLRWRIFFLLFGLYLIIGAAFTFFEKKWPIFMPPQLDVIGALFTQFGGSAGIYAGAVLVLICGLVCCWIAVLKKH